MAHPRVFVSSTYYDLHHVRDRLQAFIESFGFEPVLFEHGEVPYDHEQPLDQSCYSEIGQCHMLVLIVGQRYGSLATPTGKGGKGGNDAGNKSVTESEWESAVTKGLPVFTLVEEAVLAEYEFYKTNKGIEGVKWKADARVFELLGKLDSQPANNARQGFRNIDDAEQWLREQWAGLFERLLRSRADTKRVDALAGQIAELQLVANSIKQFSEAIVREVASGDAGAKIVEAVDEAEVNARTLGQLMASGSFQSLLKSTSTAPLEVLALLRAAKADKDFFPHLGFQPQNGIWRPEHQGSAFSMDDEHPWISSWQELLNSSK